MSPTKTLLALLGCVAALACLPGSIPAQDDPPAKDPPPQTRRDEPPRRDPEAQRKPDPRLGAPLLDPYSQDSRDNRASGQPPFFRGRRPAGAPTMPDGRRPAPGMPMGGPEGPHPPGQPPLGQPGPQGFGTTRGQPGRGSLEQLKRFDPEMYQLELADQNLERETLELSQIYRLSRPEQRAEIEKQLSERVQEHFKVRQSRRELHLKRLKEELAQLQKAIERRAEIRDEIIARRVSELLGKSDLEF